jgi:hypothetical protein
VSVYVVVLSDLYQDHIMGVFASRDAASKYIQSQDKEDGERYLINEEIVRS